MKRRKIDGETWYQWARRMFEYENCEECGKGVRGHLPAIVLGHWFAFCKSEPIACWHPGCYLAVEPDDGRCPTHGYPPNENQTQAT